MVLWNTVYLDAPLRPCAQGYPVPDDDVVRLSAFTAPASAWTGAKASCCGSVADCAPIPQSLNAIRNATCDW
ncbi:hypothetical protein IFM12275_24440 [Nocardia sputorum]|nr:hypothetical protein IFM12275_24440 [Nocardia sputorum]